MTVVEAVKKYLWIFIKYFSMVFFSFIALLPVVSCIITAFKTETEYQNTNVMTPPESWLNFDNFIDAFPGRIWAGRLSILQLSYFS